MLNLIKLSCLFLNINQIFMSLLDQIASISNNITVISMKFLSFKE